MDRNYKATATVKSNLKSRFPSKRNRLRCVRCVWMETGRETDHGVRQVGVPWAQRWASQACSCARQTDWSQCVRRDLGRTAFDLGWSADLSATCTRRSWTLSARTRSPPECPAATNTTSSIHVQSSIYKETGHILRKILDCTWRCTWQSRSASL